MLFYDEDNINQNIIWIITSKLFREATRPEHIVIFCMIGLDFQEVFFLCQDIGTYIELLQSVNSYLGNKLASFLFNIVQV